MHWDRNNQKRKKKEKKKSTYFFLGGIFGWKMKLEFGGKVRIAKLGRSVMRRGVKKGRKEKLQKP